MTVICFLPRVAASPLALSTSIMRSATSLLALDIPRCSSALASCSSSNCSLSRSQSWRADCSPWARAFLALTSSSLFLFNLTAELTIFCQETCLLCTHIIDLTEIFIILGLQFTELVLKSTAQLFKISLCFSNSLHVAGEVINLHLVFTLFLLKLLLDTLEVVDLLTQLSNAVSLLLAQSSSSGLMLQGGLLKVTADLLELSLTLLVHLNLSSSGTTGLLQPLTDLLKFPGEIGSLLLNLGTSSTLSLNLLLQFLNTGLKLLDLLLKLSTH